MVSLNNILLIFSLLACFSCAKVSYLWDQGFGQMDLLSSARPNKEVLEDSRTPIDAQQKIRQIEKYKEYFYQYWAMKPTGIYSETTLLEGDAVTYLVIASPFNKIEAKRHCFPFMGCFPYLGFFSQQKAISFARELEQDKYETYVRPVYAYSTLGYFEDKILSSFFHYDDYGLAELIFHELFHTLFFIKDEVDFNEALATYFAREMALEYFAWNNEQIKVKEAKERRQALISSAFAEKIKSLNNEFIKRSFKTPIDAKKFRESYWKQTLKPEIEKICAENPGKGCFPLKKNWNNASLAAFMTYENNGADIKTLHKNLGVDLKNFFLHLKKSYSNYKKNKKKKSFSDIFLGIVEN